MDYIIVGCGISGAVIARKLAEAGNEVFIYDRRNHIAGNMYDYTDEHGFLVQKYGPHIFHTNDEGVYQFVTAYGDWEPFKLVCGAEWDKKYTPSPFNFDTLDIFFEKEEADSIKKAVKEYYPDQQTATVVEMLKHKDPLIRKFAEYLFEKDYAPYTAKQWGMNPEEVDPSVLKRVPIRLNYSTGYFNDKYEMMPKVSYSRFISSVLDHVNIHVELEVEAKKHLSIKNEVALWDGKTISGKVIYTGPVDELFELCYGELPYRSLRFEWKYSDSESVQDAPVVAYPQAPGFTRITEYKKLPVQKGKGSSYAVEYPLAYKEGTHMEPYYPVVTPESMKTFEKYYAKAANIKNLVLCGRLADFKYYNMDQAIRNALNTAASILES